MRPVGRVSGLVGAALLAIGWAAVPSPGVGLPRASSPASLRTTVVVPDESRIYFLRDDVVVSTDRAGADLTPLSLPGLKVSVPAEPFAVAPSGRRIAYAGNSSTDPPTFPTDVWSARTDGEDPLRLTTDPAKDHDPAYSPDGRQVAFTSFRGRGRGVYLMSARGETATAPAVRLARGTQPAFFPDGRHIAYVSWAADHSSDIWVMDVDGSHKTRLTSNAPVSDHSPAVSPRRNLIAYVTYRAEDLRWRIRVMDTDGRNKTTLVRRDPFGLASPAFSPNGRQVAFARPNFLRCGNIIRKPVDGGSATKVTTNSRALDDRQPAWWGPLLVP